MATIILPVFFAAVGSSEASNRVQALRVVKKLGTDAQVLLPTFEQLLHDEEYTVRLSAIMTVGSEKIGYPKDVIRKLLSPMISDENLLVRTSAKSMIDESSD
jgi:hypothetical protein